MKQFVSPDDLQQAVDVLTKGIALSKSPEKKYTAQDMIEFGLACVATLPKEDIKELGANATMLALVAYEESNGGADEVKDRTWTDQDMIDFARWTQFMPPQSYKPTLEAFDVEIEKLRKDNWIVYCPPQDNICCRCGGDVGDNALTNFLFKIEAKSLAKEKLFHCRKPDPMRSVSHPAVYDATHGQLVILKGGAREPYHLCNQCHEDLLCTVGQFLDSKVMR